MARNNGLDVDVPVHESEWRKKDAVGKWQVKLHKAQSEGHVQRYSGFLQGLAVEVSDSEPKEAAHAFLAALAPQPCRPLPMAKDLTLMNKAAAWIVEAAEEGIITQSEAEALFRFFAGRFVERRLNSVLQHVFEEFTTEERCVFRALKSKTE